MKDLLNISDKLQGLDECTNLTQALEIVHQALSEEFGFIDRIAIALHDDKINQLKTFIHSSGGDTPLVHYESDISDAPSLQTMVSDRRPRVVNDLSLFKQGVHEHTRKIHDKGYRASCTFPIFSNQRLFGILFLNSYSKDCFDRDSVEMLSVYTHLIAQLVIERISRFETMLASLRTAIAMVHYKDPETGNHLERMSRFSKIIAKQLARSGKYDFSDEFIEYLFIFAPLHDVGKLGIPDKILLKPGALDHDEKEIMRTHSILGRKVVDTIIDNFHFQTFDYTELLREVVESHHETIDGNGYPEGLEGEKLPISARIIAVADIFDALTTVRPYKNAWNNEDAISHMKSISGTTLDADCVDALIECLDEISQIQEVFIDDFMQLSQKKEGHEAEDTFH